MGDFRTRRSPVGLRRQRAEFASTPPGVPPPGYAASRRRPILCISGRRGKERGKLQWVSRGGGDAGSRSPRIHSAYQYHIMGPIKELEN
jgi:hypothetical protein